MTEEILSVLNGEVFGVWISDRRCAGILDAGPDSQWWKPALQDQRMPVIS